MTPTRTLSDGNTLPAIGFGTYPLRGEPGIDSIVSAIEVGYRLIDTAVNYDNETEVGEAIRRSGVPRADLQITSKLPGRHHAYDDALASVHDSLDRLGLDYLDLHLIHWPNPSVGQHVEAWRALVELQRQGLVRSIGVSNFTEAHLAQIIDDSGVPPVVNQIELHPSFPQQRMREVHRAAGHPDRVLEPARQGPARVRRTGSDCGRVPARRHARPRRSCAGRSSSARSRCRSRQRPSVNARTSTSSASSSPTRRWPRSRALGRPDGRLFGGDPDVHEEM